jgi:NADH:ubiquinone oxidoreductase subunit E
MSTTTREMVGEKEHPPMRSKTGETHEIVVCDCPVCRAAGASRLVTAFARTLELKRRNCEQTPIVTLRFARLDGVCTSGPNVSVDGDRQGHFPIAEVRSTVERLLQIHEPEPELAASRFS